MADIKTQLTRPDEPEKIREKLLGDEYYIERSIARIIRDENGELLFDERDTAQMGELRAVLDKNASNVSQLIHDAHNKLDTPDASEVDPKGN